MEPTTEKYRKGLSKKESYLISALARNNRNIFNTEDVKTIVDGAGKRTIYNLVKKKWILKLKRGLYTVVPLDIGVKGADSFAMHNFVIGSKLVEPYYIGYWSALNYYGFSDQIPSTTFIATTKAKKGFEVLQTTCLFVQVTERKFFGTTEIEIEGERVKISDKNKTITDCLDRPEYCGGIDEIARSIFFSREEIDFKKARAYAVRMGNLTILKRLGYLLEASGLLNQYEGLFKSTKLSKGYSLLDPLSPRIGRYNEKWGLLINTEIKPERWMY